MDWLNPPLNSNFQSYIQQNEVLVASETFDFNNVFNHDKDYTRELWSKEDMFIVRDFSK